MKKDDYAFSNSWDSKGLTKFEYTVIEMMKASIIGDTRKNVHDRSKEEIHNHAEEAIRLTRALFNVMESEKGR